jgi:SAM-dependent methyltransferase
MPADSKVSPAATLFSRCAAPVLALVVLSAYGAAVPADETFGSHHLEQVKDLLALNFAFLGLSLRFLASGMGFDRRALQSPFFAANLLILFGILLMHGNVYVIVFGAASCATIHQLVARVDRRPRALPWAVLFGGEEWLQFRLRDALAKEWPIVALTVGLLLFTEFYEDLDEGAAASFHVTLLILIGAALLVSAAALVVQLRKEIAFAPSAAGTGPLAAGGRARPRYRKFPIRLSKEAVDALLVPWARGLVWLAASVLQLRPPYHSVEIAGGRSGKRDTEARWAAVASIIKAYQARTFLDVGCAEGWFLRRAANDFNCFSLGIDSRESRVMLGEAARLYAGDDRVAIMKVNLTPNDIRDLPACDVVICLSVLHWVISSNGLAFAQEFVRALATRTKRAMLFEIGGAEGFAKRFSDLLPPNASGEDFVRYLLTSAGVSNIRVIATSLDINNIRSRLLFVGEPARSCFSD